MDWLARFAGGITLGYHSAVRGLDDFGERVLNRQEELPGGRMLVERLVTFPTHGLRGSADLARLEAWGGRDRVPAVRALVP